VTNLLNLRVQVEGKRALTTHVSHLRKRETCVVGRVSVLIKSTKRYLT
jgi:hypothetical protein